MAGTTTKELYEIISKDSSVLAEILAEKDPGRQAAKVMELTGKSVRRGNRYATA